jgi:hypothetical protein
LSGIHEVARELENPFRNVPNEIPLSTLMAEANEALLTMYAGYHPDLYWANAAKQYAPHEGEQKPPTADKNSVQTMRCNGLGAKVDELMKKIEEQSKEIEQLKANKANDEEDKSGTPTLVSSSAS